MELLTADNGGIPVAPGGAPGGQVTQPGQVQYGDMLMGGGTSARWRQLVGWRDLPEPAVGDTPRPQAHGTYPGDVWGGSLAVTFTYLVRGSRADKLAALAAIEANTRMDGEDRPLVVDDGAGPTMRMARVIGRTIPMDKAYRTGPVECSVQWLCADPRRYSLAELTVPVELASSVGGLDYPLDYPLEYGMAVGGARNVTNDGSAYAPAVVTFTGPLVNPTLVCSADWRLAFRITLADGEVLVVDTAEGTALLNGAADRLYTIDNLSSPLERCTLPPGGSTFTLTAPSGTGGASVAYRHAYL